MYEHPSDTELYIRGRVKEFKAQSMNIDMSGVYPSPPASPPHSQEYKPSSPNYGAPKTPSYVPYQGKPVYSSIPTSPSYVPYQGKPAYSSIPTSPLYVLPTPMSPAYVKAPSKEAKHTAEARVFEDMMREHESGTPKANVPAKPVPTISDPAKEDARWSLMKDEEGMPIQDLDTGLEYYTNGLCDQEQTVQETEIALQRRVKEMNDAASILSYDKFCLKYDDVDRFQNKLRAQLCDYRGAAKLLEANLVIRNEVCDSKLVWAAEEAIAAASKLIDGLLKSANEADEFMNIAHDVAEVKCLWDESEDAASFDEVDDGMIDFDSFFAAGKDVVQEDDDNLPWNEEEFEAELEDHTDALAAAEEVEKLAAIDATKMADFDAAFIGRVNAAECPAGKSPHDCLSQADKERYDDMLRGLLLSLGDDYEDDEDSHAFSENDSIFGLADAISPLAANSSLPKTDVNFETNGFAGFNAGAKAFAHKPKVSSPLAVQPVLTVEDEVAPTGSTPEPFNFDFLGGDHPSDMVPFAAGGILTAAFLEADDDFVEETDDDFAEVVEETNDDLVEEIDVVSKAPTLKPHTPNRKRSRIGDDDASMKKAKISHEFSDIPEDHSVDAPPEREPLAFDIDFLSGDRPADTVKFAAGGLLTAEFLEADEAPVASEIPVLKSLPSNRKRTRSGDGDIAWVSLKKVKFTHDFAISEVLPVVEAPELVKNDLLSGDCPSDTVNSAAGGLLTAELLEADDEVPVLEALNSKRKLSSSDDAFTPMKKAKFTHDCSPAYRPIKAMKTSRKANTPANMKPFSAGGFTDATKDDSVVEPLSASRKRTCPSSGHDTPVQRSPSPVPSSGHETPQKKVKLSASTTELIETLLFDLESYGVDGQLVFAAKKTTAVTGVRKTKLAAKVGGVWRDAISKLSSSSGVKMTAVMGKLGGKKDVLGGLREKYLATRLGGKGGGSLRKTARV